MVQFNFDLYVTGAVDCRWRPCFTQGHFTGTVSDWLIILIFSDNRGFEHPSSYFKNLIQSKITQPRLKLLWWHGISCVALVSKYTAKTAFQILNSFIDFLHSWIIPLKTNEMWFISKEREVRDILIVSPFQKIWFYLIWVYFCKSDKSDLQLSVLLGFVLCKVTARPRLHNLI